MAQLVEHTTCNTRAVGSVAMGAQYENECTYYYKLLWIEYLLYCFEGTVGSVDQ